MLWLMLPLVACDSFLIEESERHEDIAESVLRIANDFLKSRCLAFLFPINYSNPDLVNAPHLVRSKLLQDIHSEWAPNLPAVNRHFNILSLLQPEPGALNYLQCAHIILLEYDNPFVHQIDEVIYTFFNNYYENGGGEKTRMVVVSDGEVDSKEVKDLLWHMYDMGDIDVVFLGIEDAVIKVFTLFPFGTDGTSCPENNINLRVLDVWNNTNFLLGKDLFPNKVPGKFNNCVMKVTTVHFPPFVFGDSDKSLYEGIDYRILGIIALHMGVQPNYTVYNGTRGWMWHEKKGKRTVIGGSMVDLRLGKAWLIMSAGTNIVFHYPCIHVPYGYMTTQVAWFFRAPQEIPTWQLIYLVFSGTLWLMVVVTSALFPCSLYLLGKVEKSTYFLKNLSTCLLVSWGIALGCTGASTPRTHTIRVLLTAWLIYTMHLSIAYTGSLTGLMTAGKREDTITTFQQMIQRKLKTSIHPYMEDAFKFVDDPVVKKVMADYVLSTNYDQILDQVDTFGNLTVLEIDAFLAYNIKRKKAMIYKSNLNTNFYSMGIMLRRNHFIGQRIADLSSRIVESGLASHIVHDLTLFTWTTSPTEVRAYNLKDLAGAFFVLFIGSLLSVVAFIAELVYGTYLKCVNKEI